MPTTAAPPRWLHDGAGALDALLRALRLRRDTPGDFVRTALFAGFACWLPFAAIAVAGRLGGAQPEAITRDLGAHARLLVAIPLYLYARRLLALRVRDVLGHLRQHDLVGDPAGLDRIAARDAALVRSRAAALALFAIAFAVGQLLYRDVVQSSGVFTGAGARLSRGAASAWYAWVAFPVFFYAGLRVLLAWLAWSYDLVRISRLGLRTMPTHPDRAGGISALARPADAIALLVLGSTTVAACSWASQILEGHAHVKQFGTLLAVWACVAVALAFVPLLVFVGTLFRTRRRGQREYGILALTYTRMFHRRWIEQTPGPELLGSQDIQALNDLGGSFAVIQEMRAVPFGLRELATVLMAALFPFVPVLLTEISLPKLLLRAIETVVGIGR